MYSKASFNNIEEGLNKGAKAKQINYIKRAYNSVVIQPVLNKSFNVNKCRGALIGISTQVHC
jgi:hypothetical protein